MLILTVITAMKNHITYKTIEPTMIKNKVYLIKLLLKYTFLIIFRTTEAENTSALSTTYVIRI